MVYRLLGVKTEGDKKGYAYPGSIAAAANGKEKMVETLLAQGADVKTTNAFGQTAYDKAIIFRFRALAKELRERMPHPLTNGEKSVSKKIRTVDSDTQNEDPNKRNRDFYSRKSSATKVKLHPSDTEG